MELILELIYERKKNRDEWKQIIHAVILALFAGGMYHYVSLQTEYMSGKVGMSAVSVISYAGSNVGLKTDFFNWEIISDTMPEGFRATVSETADDTENHMELFAESGAEDIGHTGKNENTAGKEKGLKKSKGRTSFTKTGVTEKAIFLPSDKMPHAINMGKIMENAEESNKAEEIIKVPEPLVQKEFSGFICDAEGHIVGFADPSKFMKDSLVVMPRNNACTGIKRGSFKGLEKMISEIYIPANIIYIEPGTFDDLLNLIYIETQPGNAEYYSVNGILYYRDGKVAAYPNRQRNQ